MLTKYLSPCVPLESKLEIYSCNFLLDASRQHLPIMEENNDVTNIDKYLGHNNSPGRGSKFGTSTRTDTRKSQEDEELKFPPLKCSKYTWIGHPSMQKRRKKRQEQKERDKVWIRPILTIENPQPMRRTKHEPLGYEYSRHSQNFFDTLEAYDIDTSITLPELSPRATNLDKDPQVMKEKNLVFDFITETGQLQRYAMDKAVVPVVYGDVFLSENNRKKYIRAMYVKDKRRDGDRTSYCPRFKAFAGDKCQFCDVMGNRYCQYCIEQRNKHFAQRYERKMTEKPNK